MILDVATKCIFERRFPGQWGLHSRCSSRGKPVGGPVRSKVATMSQQARTEPLACGGGGSDTAQPPAESDGDGGSGIAQPLASWGSEGAVDLQQWRAAHGYRYYSSCSSSSSEGPEYECPEYGD